MNHFLSVAEARLERTTLGYEPNELHAHSRYLWVQDTAFLIHTKYSCYFLFTTHSAYTIKHEYLSNTNHSLLSVD